MSLYKNIVEKSKQFFSNPYEKIQTTKEEVEEEGDELRIKIPSLFFPKDDTPRVITHISLVSALKIIGVLVAIFLLGKFLSQTAEILLSVGLALFISAALFPAIDFLEQKKIPRGVSIAAVFLGVVTTITFLVSNILPALIDQFIELGQWIVVFLNKIYSGNYSSLPEFLQKYGPNFRQALLDINESFFGEDKGLLQILNDNVDKIKPLGEGVTTVFFSAFGSIILWTINLILVLILAFFILLDREKIKIFFLSFFSPRIQKYADIKTSQMQEKMAAWIHGQMILFMVMGGTTWVVLTWLEVPYALSLAFLTGLAEFVPYVGPLFAFILTAPIAFGQGAEIGFAVVIFFAILQALEGNVLVPFVMNKTVGVPPLVTIIGMLVGFQFLGVLGAIMAVPISSILSIFLFDIRKIEKEKFDGDQEVIEKNISS